MLDFNVEVLMRCLPEITVQTAQHFIDPLKKTFDKFDIHSNVRQACFLSQTAYESGFFAHTRENLNYSAEGLLKTFPKYFDKTLAEQYAHQPEKIANRVYANRLGNGDEHSGDGWKYIGRGLIQITGMSNYMLCGKALDANFITYNTLMESTPFNVLSAGWFWDSNHINILADKKDIVGITKKINGGLHGYEQRLKLFNRIYGILGV